MYRTPRDPGGFPFGYNWRATGLGLVLLVGFNFLATQYIAAQFRYQPALGTPLKDRKERQTEVCRVALEKLDEYMAVYV